MAEGNSKICKECGCSCKKCTMELHLRIEIENLQQKLLEKENWITTTTETKSSGKYPLQEELSTWQDKYSRLYEAHKRVQKVNQNLEEKLLNLVDRTETEKNDLTKDVATLSHKLAEANYTVQRLQEVNERYKNDVNLAIQLLQCKPTNFVSQKLDSLPNEMQAKVSSYVASKRKANDSEPKVKPEIRSIKVPIATFPPTAMVYSVPKSPEKEEIVESESKHHDIVSAAIVAKILEERERERSLTKHCDSCTCSKSQPPALISSVAFHSIGTQTGNEKYSLCLHCNSDLSNRSSPLEVRIIKTETMTDDVQTETDKDKKCPGKNVIIKQDRDSSKLLDNNIHIQNNLLCDSKKNVTLNKESLSKPSLHSIKCQNDKFKIYNLTNQQLRNYHIDACAGEDLITFNNKSKTHDTKIDLNNFDPILGHHRLCNQAQKKSDGKLEKKCDNVSENVKNNNVKVGTQEFHRNEIDHKLKDSTRSEFYNVANSGPRFCSMRVQAGSKNILLDNVHSNFEPILYTRHNSDKKSKHASNTEKCRNGTDAIEKKIDQIQKSYEQCTKLIENSCESDYRPARVHSSHRSMSNSSEDISRSMSETGTRGDSEEKTQQKILSGGSTESSVQRHHLERVAEWVQNSMEQNTETVTNEVVDAEKMAQMEYNVKNFLLKTNWDSASYHSHSHRESKINNNTQIPTENKNSDGLIVTETQI